MTADSVEGMDKWDTESCHMNGDHFSFTYGSCLRISIQSIDEDDSQIDHAPARARRLSAARRREWDIVTSLAILRS